MASATDLHRITSRKQPSVTVSNDRQRRGPALTTNPKHPYVSVRNRQRLRALRLSAPTPPASSLPSPRARAPPSPPRLPKRWGLAP